MNEVVGWHKSEDGAVFEIKADDLRTCPECGSENAYECPDPERDWGALICWCDDAQKPAT